MQEITLLDGQWFHHSKIKVSLGFTVGSVESVSVEDKQVIIKVDIGIQVNVAELIDKPIA